MRNMISVFLEDGKKFNFRVEAIILDKSQKRFLIQKIIGRNYYILPGGRLELFEDSKSALKRELFEELGIDNIEPKERLLLESFFDRDKNTKYHQIEHCFVVKLDNNFQNIQSMDNFNGKEGKFSIFKWAEIEKIEEYNIQPRVLKEVIKTFETPYEYKILKENFDDNSKR